MPISHRASPFWQSHPLVSGIRFAQWFASLLRHSKTIPSRESTSAIIRVSIDWKRLAAQPNVRFAIMKATEGGDHRDRRFAENWQAAEDAGIVRGAYHFFTFCRPGREQAQNVLATVPVEPGTLPIAVDLEFTGNCGKVPTLEEMAPRSTHSSPS